MGPPRLSTSATTTETVFRVSRGDTTARRLGRPVAWQLERRILHEDGSLEALQCPAGLEPELLDQDLASLVVHAKRLGLATGRGRP